MKHLLWLLLSVFCLQTVNAQITIGMTSPVSFLQANQSSTLDFTQTPTGGAASPAGMQIDVQMPPDVLSVGTATTPISSKIVQCASNVNTGNNQRCLVVSFTSQTTFPNGAWVSIPFTMKSAITSASQVFHVVSAAAASAAGVTIPVVLPADLTIASSAPPTISVSVTPATASLAPGASQQFTATVTGSTNQAVTWQRWTNDSYGTLSTTGLYTVASTAPIGGVATFRATSVADPTKYATVTITIAAPPAVNNCDLNGDGQVTSLDIQTVLDVVLGRTTTTKNIDLTKDGKVDVGDVINMALVAAGGTCPI